MFDWIHFSPDWFMAFGSILLLDLLLSGDNAIIIALACKNLPASQRKKAIFWGSLGAVALRVSLTLVAATLLDIPYLQFCGGLALVWIAVKLLAKDDSDDVQFEQSSRLMAAVKTILLADLIMSLDNVLALAAVAQTVPDSKYLLLILGLMASIPLVVCSSQLLMKLMDRFPAIIYLGTGILGYAAAEMIIADKAIGALVHNVHLHIQVGLTLAVITVGHILKIHSRQDDSEPVIDSSNH